METKGDMLNAQGAALFLSAHVETIRRLARKGGHSGVQGGQGLAI